MATFHVDNLWSRIRAIARDRGPRWVAVPYVSSGATQRLPLKRGDLLVTRCNRPTVEAGQTDPREIVRFIRRGVRVHHVGNLHAKVYVSHSRSIVSSANLSNESEHRLVEAGIESTTRAGIAEAKRFVASLTGDAIELEFAQALIKYYKPPKLLRRGQKSPRSRGAGHTDLWVIAVQQVDYSDEDQSAADVGEKLAKERGASERTDRIMTLTLTGGRPGPRFGDRVLQIDGTLRSKQLIQPARVMSARKYRSSRGTPRLMLALTVPKQSRTFQLRTAIRKVGRRARVLGTFNQRKLTDPDLAVAIARIWPDDARRV